MHDYSQQIWKSQIIIAERSGESQNRLILN